ncbi:MAG: fasciclin domain-containing protein [Cyanobacteriota bacterium]
MIQPNIPATNGVIHVVDKVILPPDIQASLGANQTAQ